MTQNPRLYRIDKENRELQGLKNSREIIQRIINSSYKKLGFKTKFDSNTLKETSKDDIVYYLHLFNTNETESDWKNFLPVELTSNQDFVQQKLSLILFAESDNQLFCIIGGNSYKIIVPFIDHSFGLNTYARIMNPSEDELASIKSRGITGARAGINEQFRDNYRIIDFIKFGKLPQEIHLKLSQEITDLHFDFLKRNDDERLQIYVGKSFKIKKSVDFNTLHRIIVEFREILQLAPSDYLSSYKEIRDEKFINEYLRSELITSLYNDAGMLGKADARRFEHDFCNPNDIEKFYEADEYHLKQKSEKGGYLTFDKVNERKEIYDKVLKRAVELHGVNDKFNFMVFLQGVRITCYQNNEITIGSSFLFHITSEFSIKGQPYFLVDTKWYKLRDSFIDDLKVNTHHILKTYQAPRNILTECWDKKTLRREGDYNMLYNDKNGYIVIDTLITDGIELCDILHYDDQNLYLIHVKYGFSSSIRELSNQIMISARRLRETLASDNKELLDKVYRKLIDKGYNIDSMTLDEFKELFTSRKINYILACTSQLSEDLLIEDNIDRFDSNIARFSLIQCSGDMRANYYDLFTHQIRRE
ncbi:DUF6119 family protein [Reichenbachiella sp.]